MKPIDLEEIVKDIEKVGFEEWLLAELARAFQTARKGKTKTFDENEFEVNWLRNLRILHEAILSRTYKPGASLTFIIYEPMIREIFAAPFRDRIVHHFLYNLSAGWWDQQFIEDSYSCRVGKGTLYGVKRLQEKMRLVSDNFTREAWIAKFDLRGYFMSLRREDLYQLVSDGLCRQFDIVRGSDSGDKLYAVCKIF